jgi:hypothetical protein
LVVPGHRITNKCCWFLPLADLLLKKTENIIFIFFQIVGTNDDKESQVDATITICLLINPI